MTPELKKSIDSVRKSLVGHRKGQMQYMLQHYAVIYLSPDGSKEINVVPPSFKACYAGETLEGTRLIVTDVAHDSEKEMGYTERHNGVFCTDEKTANELAMPMWDYIINRSLVKNFFFPATEEEILQGVVFDCREAKGNRSVALAVLSLIRNVVEYGHYPMFNWLRDQNIREDVSLLLSCAFAVRSDINKAMLLGSTGHTAFDPAYLTEESAKKFLEGKINWKAGRAQSVFTYGKSVAPYLIRSECFEGGSSWAPSKVNLDSVLKLAKKWEQLA